MTRLTDAAARDLDETRRLLYMTLFVGKTDRWELAGTLVNALRHHQGVQDPDLEDKITDYLNRVPGELAAEDDTWIRAQIQARIDALA
jgi:hypothetical protein